MPLASRTAVSLRREAKSPPDFDRPLRGGEFREPDASCNFHDGNVKGAASDNQMGKP
jgi:hypothetical protein